MIFIFKISAHTKQIEYFEDYRRFFRSWSPNCHLIIFPIIFFLECGKSKIFLVQFIPEKSCLRCLLEMFAFSTNNTNEKTNTKRHFFLFKDYQNKRFFD